MKKDINAADQLRRLYPDEGVNEEFSREVTFQVTEKCNLVCTYCYQGNKSGKNMSWETAKTIVDLLFRMYEEDDETAFINKKTKQIILDFIGGEPLLQVKLIDKICSYFWDRAIEEHHIWAETFLISISSNGTVYFNPDVQEFIKKFHTRLSFSVSIDGPKEMHDACRIFPDGSGSWELAKRAQDDFNAKYNHSIGTKATIARNNLPFLKDLIVYYVEQGFTLIHANYVYEEEWNFEDARLLYDEMISIADYILSLDYDVNLSLFEENFFTPKAEDDLQNWCGGTGKMLAFDPDGRAFPCIRYMASSLNGEQEPLCIGDCISGLYCNEETCKIRDMLAAVNRRTQNTDECFYCSIASGCSNCSGWDYQLNGSPDIRCTRICPMHKARSLANVYYWNKYYRKNNIAKRFHRYLADEEALKILSKSELEELDKLELQ